MTPAEHDVPTVSDAVLASLVREGSSRLRSLREMIYLDTSMALAQLFASWMCLALADA